MRPPTSDPSGPITAPSTGTGFSAGEDGTGLLSWTNSMVPQPQSQPFLAETCSACVRNSSTPRNSWLRKPSRSARSFGKSGIGSPVRTSAPYAPRCDSPHAFRPLRQYESCQSAEHGIKRLDRYDSRRRYPAAMLHELWEEPFRGGFAFPMFCLAGPRGDGARAMLPPGSRLTWLVEADSHDEAITSTTSTRAEASTPPNTRKKTRSHTANSGGSDEVHHSVDPSVAIGARCSTNRGEPNAVQVATPYPEQ
jgi:hypothetical protein